MSSIKPPLHEVLHYPEESRRMLMQGFADAVDRIAANNGRIDCRSFRKWATAYTPYRPQTKPQTAYEGEPLF